MSESNHWRPVSDFSTYPNSFERCDRPEVVGITEYDGALCAPKRFLYFRGVNSRQLPIDLNEGFEHYRFREESEKDHLSKIEWYLINQKRFISYEKGCSQSCKVYTERRVLIHILSTPYKKENWIIYATMFNGSLYLRNKYEETHRTPTPHDSYHFKFRQHCFSELPDKPSNTDAPIDESKQIYCIYRRKLGDFDLHYSAEISGIKSDKEIKDLDNMQALSECNFVLTKLVKDNDKNWMNNLKTLTWWIQADFSNAEDIYVGGKERSGFVRKPVQHIKTSNLIHDRQSWKPLVCLDWLQNFLSHFEREMHYVDCPYTVYEIMYTASNRKLQYRIHKGKNEHSFLSEEFIEFMNKNKKLFFF